MYAFSSPQLNPLDVGIGLSFEKTRSERPESLTCWGSGGGAGSRTDGCNLWGGALNLQTRLTELHRQWELLLEKMREKGVKLLQAQKLVQFLRECEDVMDWINDKVRWGRRRAGLGRGRGCSGVSRSGGGASSETWSLRAGRATGPACSLGEGPSDSSPPSAAAAHPGVTFWEPLSPSVPR